jgi:aromatic-L-amino-acid/L-tryptophan decarboxylase
MSEADAAADTASLDPSDWSELRALGHRMLDDVFDDLAGIREQPVWRPMPGTVRAAWAEALPRDAMAVEEVYRLYRRQVAPYGVGNRHPQFLGWVHGGGTAVGMLAEMLAAGLNANCGGRDHAPIACERQVIRWASEMLGLPAGSSGLVLSGTSMANFVAVMIARTAALGDGVRRAGVGRPDLIGYASAGAHMCVARAFDMAGLGSDALRLIPCDETNAMSLPHLRDRIAADRSAGLRPFLVVGTAGSVDTGAIDDLTAIAETCAAERLWFHVDAAFGAIAMLSPKLRGLFAGMERADSVAFDFHKWAQVPYDAGCIVVRDSEAHRAAFAREVAYLRRDARGLAAGEPWPVDLGPELSRGFRALKVWMTLKTYGADRIGQVTEQSCALARSFATAVDIEPTLELSAPVALNIVCFRYWPGDDAMQTAIAADLQENGSAVLSVTTIRGRTVLRAAFVNHRTGQADVDVIVRAVVAAGLGRTIRLAIAGGSYADNLGQRGEGVDSFVCSVLGRRNTDIKPPSVLLEGALDCAAREDWRAAYDILQRAAGTSAAKRAAHFMLWEVCQILGDPEAATANLRAALQEDPVTSRCCPDPLRRILVLAVPGDFQANLPLDALLGAPDNQLHTLWLADPEATVNDPLSAFGSFLPEFDCIFIAIAEDVRHHRALEAADRVAEALSVPVINQGRRIAAVSRSGAAQLLGGLPDAVVPSQTLVEREWLAAGTGLAFPFIVRPAGSHAGKDLARIDSAESLQSYLAGVTADRFYVAPFVDYQSNDGLWRKYRIIFVDGRPWPYHLAIHNDWAIWYYNARMDLDPWKRQEEARFVQDISQVFPERAMRALRLVASRVGLDYFGIDCGLLPDGRLVVFEVETGMIVHDWDSSDIYPYKQACTQAIRQATEQMIDSRIECRRAGVGRSGKSGILRTVRMQ